MGETNAPASAAHSSSVSPLRPQLVFLTDTPPPKKPFLARATNALSASFAAHVAAVALGLFVIRSIPEPAVEVQAPQDLPDIIWIAQEGPGGGGGGGGNQMPDPPRKAELPGKEKITVPVAPPPKLEAPKPKDEPKPDLNLNIPAVTMASSNVALPGAVTGLSAPTGSQGPGSGGGSGTGVGTGIGPGRGSGLGPGEGGGTGGGYYRPGSGIENPRVVKEVPPRYTNDAMRAKLQGVVELECVVLPNGTVGQVEVVRSLDATFGLDLEAIKAVRQWRFEPGKKGGQAVPVLVTIEITFTLR
jgi:TonB family protein